MTNHTPGPWHRDEYGNVIDLNGERVVFAGVSCAMTNQPIAEANTYLITAAPDLLAACEAAVDALYVARFDLRRESMSAAIAKAKGESND